MRVFKPFVIGPLLFVAVLFLSHCDFAGEASDSVGSMAEGSGGALKGMYKGMVKGRSRGIFRGAIKEAPKSILRMETCLVNLERVVAVATV